MLKNLLLLITSLILLEVKAITAQDSLVFRTETFIIEEKYDSAKQLIPLLGKSDYVKTLNQIAINKEFNITTLLEFVSIIQSRIKVDEDKIEELLKKNLKTPIDLQDIKPEYTELLFIQITNLRNRNKISEANHLNERLENYIALFDSNQVEVKRAKIYHKIHRIVTKTIQMKGEESEKLGLELLKEAEAISDTNMICAAYYNLFNAYKVKDELENSIIVAEKAKKIDESRIDKSSYYYDNLFLLMDAYMYKRQNLSQVGDLLKTIYQNKKVRPRTYEMLARYLLEIKEDSTETKAIFNLLAVNNIVEFTEKALEDTEGFIYDYDQYYFYNACAFTLHKYKEHDLAMKVLMKAVFLTRKIYSEDLSKALAEAETSQIRKEKELEITHEKEQTKLYLIIAILVGLLSILSILAFVRKRNQASILKEKNTQIEHALNEKQILLKEVHHRVKNNFQIISSLLELQTKGIEDEKAKTLALEGKNRIKSMALIHQKLYQNDELLINFDEYIKQLLNEIISMYGNEKQTTITVNVPKLAFDVDTAIPLGLIINELVTNSFKYGLNDINGKLCLSISKDDNEGGYQLLVKDNGNGLPDNFDLSKAKSLGLRLVKSLSKQLHGYVTYSFEEGSVFKVFFKNTQARNETD